MSRWSPVTPEETFKALVDSILQRTLTEHGFNAGSRLLAEELAKTCGCRFGWTQAEDAPPAEAECEYHRELREAAERLTKSAQSVMQWLGPRTPAVDYTDPENLAGLLADVDLALKELRAVGIAYQYHARPPLTT